MSVNHNPLLTAIYLYIDQTISKPSEFC